MKKADLIIFGGQSNMMGLTGECPEDNEPIENALEYRFLSDSFVPLKHPVGEDWDVMLSAANDGGGSLIPAFCREYIKETGKSVIAIRAARGSTTIGEWQKGTQRFYYMSEKITKGIEKAKEIRDIENIYYVWLQGESDAVIRTTTQEYEENIIKYKNTLKQYFSIDKFCIIKVGYFFCISQWHTQIADYEYKKSCDEAIMAAQENVVKNDGDFIMLTRVCTDLSMKSEYINPQESGHYNNAAMEIIGTKAGKSLAEYSNLQKE